MADEDQTKDVRQQTDADAHLSDEDLEQAAGGTTSDPPEGDNPWDPSPTNPNDPEEPFGD